MDSFMSLKITLAVGILLVEIQISWQKFNFFLMYTYYIFTKEWWCLTINLHNYLLVDFIYGAWFYEIKLWLWQILLKKKE